MMRRVCSSSTARIYARGQRKQEEEESGARKLSDDDLEGMIGEEFVVEDGPSKVAARTIILDSFFSFKSTFHNGTYA